MQLTITDAGGNENQLSLQYDDVYDRPSSLSSWEGTWVSTDEGVTSDALTVDADGAFFSQRADGCISMGGVSIIDSDRNLWISA